MRNADLVKHPDPAPPASRPPAGRRTHAIRKRKPSADEAEYRLFAAAAGSAIVVLMALVAALVSQMP